MRLVAWGTYDLGKPRTRILLAGLRQNGMDVTECHVDVWRGIEDKSQVRGIRRWIRLLLGWLGSYPRLVARYLRCPRHDAVLVAYPGALDVLVIRPWARLRKVPIVWDVFVPLHDTVVEDRGLLGPGRFPARLLRWIEGAAARRATAVLLDTAAQAEHFRATYRLLGRSIGSVPVGAEVEAFAPFDPPSEAGLLDDDGPPTVLFFGQMIPLHGIATVLEAARAPAGQGLRWRIVGDGQEGWKLERALRDRRMAHVRWERWVPYERLRDEILRADVCLGIFGTTPKAARVIPNKVYQILAVGRPLVTRDSPAIRELLVDGLAVRLVAAGDPAALLAAVQELVASCDRGRRWHDAVGPSLRPASVGRHAVQELRRVLGFEGGVSAQ